MVCQLHRFQQSPDLYAPERAEESLRLAGIYFLFHIMAVILAANHHLFHLQALDLQLRQHMSRLRHTEFFDMVSALQFPPAVIQAIILTLIANRSR
jgi:hypothetical protein